MKGLTRRQREVLDFVQEYIELNRFSPSYREIQHHFKFSSIGSVFKHLSVLKRKGALVSEKHTSRSVNLQSHTDTSRHPFEIHLPFIGHVSAGEPIELFPRSQTLAVPDFLVQNPEISYILRAQGDSLNDEMIGDGDLLLVEGRSEALAGELILGTLPDNQTFVKHYFPEGKSVRLTSRSASEKVVSHEELAIQGVLVSLCRLFH